MNDLSHSSRSKKSSFAQVVEGFLSQPGLPFASVLSAERMERIFSKHENLFGRHGVYSTAVVLWAFVGQILRDGKEASCQSAVAAIISYRLAIGQHAPTSDTGDYCRARNKLSLGALRELTIDIADEVEAQSEEKWLWKSMHAKLVDGFTFTMPDTAENQADFPSSKSQKPGVGLPIARAAVILSLATGCAMDLAVGPYKGKETGETALLRQLLGSLNEGDIAVMDRYYCSFMMIALLMNQKVHVCTRMHQLRKVDFRRGRRLGKHDHIIHWVKPKRPTWMDQETYDTIPDTIELREIRYKVIEKGKRTKTITVVTTLTDSDIYPKEEIAELYGFRWNAELDIRSIKQTLNLDHLRCNSPGMILKELWTTLLGYNLIRTTAAAAALLHNKQPRHISFTSTCQFIISSWMLFASQSIDENHLEHHCRELLSRIADCQVANRPGRVEPRVIKRRRHRYPLMQEPRNVLRSRLMSSNS